MIDNNVGGNSPLQPPYKAIREYSVKNIKVKLIKKSLRKWKRIVRKLKGKREYILRIRLTEKEHKKLKLLSEETGFTISDIVRTALSLDRTSRLPRGKRKEITLTDRYLYELNKIGINLNQVVRRINTYRMIDEQALVELQRIAVAVEEIKERILSELEQEEELFSFSSRGDTDDSEHIDS